MLTILYFLKKIIDIYSILIIASSLISWVSYSTQPNILTETIKKLTDPAYRLVRKYIPFCIIGNIDISPIIIIFALNIIYYLIQILMFNSTNSNINVILE